MSDSFVFHLKFFGTRDVREELKESRSLLVFKFVGSEDLATTVSLGVGKTFFLAPVSERFISTRI